MEIPDTNLDEIEGNITNIHNNLDIIETQMSNYLEPDTNYDEDNDDNQDNESENDDITDEMRLIKSKKILGINIDYFNSNFLYFNINNQRSLDFINMIYRSPTIFLDGIIFETPWMKVVKPLHYLKLKNDEKCYLELSFIGYEDDPEIKLFYNCINSIDKTTINFINKHQNIFKNNNSKYLNEIYCRNIKLNKLEDNSKYNCIRVKINKNIKRIIYNNDNYGNNIENLKFVNGYAKCWIVCNGLWRYNNKVGMSWRGIDIKLNNSAEYNQTDNNEYNENNEYNNISDMPSLFQFDEDMDDEDINNIVNDIPNFEIETDSDYFQYNKSFTSDLDIPISHSLTSINDEYLTAIQDMDSE